MCNPLKQEKPLCSRRGLYIIKVLMNIQLDSEMNIPSQQLQKLKHKNYNRNIAPKVILIPINTIIEQPLPLPPPEITLCFAAILST